MRQGQHLRSEKGYLHRMHEAVGKRENHSQCMHARGKKQKKDNES